MTAPQVIDQIIRQPTGRDWRASAACAGVDPELFFPAAEAGPVLDAQVAAAKAVCARCPVVPECLADALAGIPHGVAGGLTEEERRALRLHDGRDGLAVAAEDSQNADGGDVAA